MHILSIFNENFLFKHSLKVMISFKNISISLILSFNFRTQKVSQKMNFCSRWYQIMKLWLLNWKINVILYQISLFNAFYRPKEKVEWCETLCISYKFLKTHLYTVYTYLGGIKFLQLWLSPRQMVVWWNILMVTDDAGNLVSK